MANLNSINSITIPTTLFQKWGNIWQGNIDSKGNAKSSNCFDKKQGMDFGKEIDPIIANEFAAMLGGI
ncbi:hypothetical protein SAMN04487928_109133 [Butyrivibrio proteoclasticus]|uniref:Uncharacterized protein n=1 Tax=Butyrivibrio proteoclasticus TaxID=43305 RepID=A0A1I5TQW8_9FIRM|nr:hypothetical protein [Butyrivibrio proteoclasticus]SFP84736.1 hypothetical protein SAMN04487928_109133 [Butyrivibrio proteoclasticus]